MLRKLLRHENKFHPEHNQPLWLISGLGNPGTRYVHNWHNLGFMVLDLLAERHHLPIRRIRCQSLLAQGNLPEGRVILQKPATYMNNSGIAVQEALRYFRVEPDHCLIIYDDVDLPAGQLRIRPNGGPGTHNGMRSIISHLGHESFPRLRIGIGPRPVHYDMAEFVLSDIPPQQRDLMKDTLNRAADAVELMVSSGLEAAMAKYNLRS
ncbi:MAG: aminoacyl-tRNA hydrolase [Clostridia bacterium]|nr:aminoacyl-tRNA hydrolase [Clostridia bacterium]